MESEHVGSRQGNQLKIRVSCLDEALLLQAGYLKHIELGSREVHDRIVGQNSPALCFLHSIQDLSLNGCREVAVDNLELINISLVRREACEQRPYRSDRLPLDQLGRDHRRPNSKCGQDGRSDHRDRVHLRERRDLPHRDPDDQCNCCANEHPSRVVYPFCFFCHLEAPAGRCKPRRKNSKEETHNGGHGKKHAAHQEGDEPMMSRRRRWQDCGRGMRRSNWWSAWWWRAWWWR